MTVLAIKVIVALAGALIVAFVSNRFGTASYILAVVSAAVTLLSLELIGLIALKTSDPAVRIHTSESIKGELVIEIQKKKGFVKNLDVEIHTVGPVINIYDFNEKTSYSSIEKRVIGYDKGYAQNTVEIGLTDVSGDKLSFKILYEPIPGDILNLEGMNLPESVEAAAKINIKQLLETANVLRYRYTWDFDGNTQEEKRIQSLITDIETSEPRVLMKGFWFKVGEVMSPEPVKEQYNAGPPVRLF